MGEKALVVFHEWDMLLISQLRLVIAANFAFVWWTTRDSIRICD